MEREGYTESVQGNNNTIAFGKDVRTDRVNIKIQGNNNKVIIGDKAVLRTVTIVMESDNNTVIIGDNSWVTFRSIQKLTPGNRLEIGDETSIGGANFINGEGSTITVGDKCMFSYNIDVRSTDSHAMFDTETGERINHAQDITIGDAVWIGAHATILKGTHIHAGSVLAIQGVATKDYKEENVALAGNPARIVKRNVRWEKPLLG